MLVLFIFESGSHMATLDTVSDSGTFTQKPLFFISFEWCTVFWRQYIRQDVYLLQLIPSKCQITWYNNYNRGFPTQNKRNFFCMFKNSVIFWKNFYVLLTVHLSIILATDQLNAQILFFNKFNIPLHVSSTVVLIIRRSKLYYTASGIIRHYRWLSGRPPTECDETRCCIIQFNLLMMSKTVLETCRWL